MKAVRRIVLFVIAFILSVIILTLLFSPPSGIRILLNEAKEPGFNTLILGQSHGECGYNPYIISDELGVNAMNASRRTTPINNFKYIIEEANRDGQYNTVILDIDPYYWIMEQNRDFGTDMNLLPYLTGQRKLSYFKECIWDINYSVLFCDYYISLENIKLIPKALKAKFTKEYILNQDYAMNYVDEYLKSEKAYAYKGRGFLYGVDRAPDLGWATWDFDGALPSNLESFDEIVSYCKDNNIRLICTQSALPPSRLTQQNMSYVNEYFTNLCNSYGIEFYDFNYAKNLKRTDFDYVDADGHPMGELADRQTKILCDVMKSQDKSQYFYNTYEEVLSNL